MDAASRTEVDDSGPAYRGHRLAGLVLGPVLSAAISVLHQMVIGYAAEAVTAVVVRRHRLAALDAAMAADAHLRERVLAALRQELAAVRLQMLLLGQMSATEKVATFLRALAARAAEPGAPVHLPMRRTDIADYLGLTIETVSRKLGELKRLGVIELPTPCEFRIAQPVRLEALAEAA